MRVFLPIQLPSDKVVPKLNKPIPFGNEIQDFPGAVRGNPVPRLFLFFGNNLCAARFLFLSVTFVLPSLDRFG